MTSHIFIIDDDPILRLLTRIMIQGINDKVICHECKNGKVGMEALEPMLSSSYPLIVLLDINMPVLNGWEFLDQLEKKEMNKLKNLKLYIITSSIDENDKLKAGQYPVVEKFYSKPLSIQDMKEILN